MARFILSHRRAGKFRDDEKRKSRMAVNQAWTRSLRHGSELLADMSPPDETHRRIVHFESDPQEIESLRRELPPEVILEPEILHQRRKPGTIIESLLKTEAPVAPEAQMNIQVSGSSHGLLGSEVTLVLVSPDSSVTQDTKISDQHGSAAFEFDSTKWSPGAETVAPPGAFWSMVQASQNLQVNFDCPPLGTPGPLAWWHHALNVNAVDLDRGQGIKIGVIDTGCGPHPCLRHVDNLGSIILGKYDINGGADIDVHGTHICGLLGARPEMSGQLAGLSPGLTIMSIRVYPPGDDGANQGDVAQAIDVLSKEHQADLLNLSLTADSASEIEHDAIIDALERGTLCVCASGNTAGAISFPAAFAEAVSVGALGMKDWGPVSSVAAAVVPSAPDHFGTQNFFVPLFSNSGLSLGCAAPGVGVISTYPARYGLDAPYADLSGTSCATPLAGGALASLLSGMPEFLQLPRNRARAEFARQTLFASCRNIGLAKELQGNGLPQTK